MGTQVLTFLNYGACLVSVRGFLRIINFNPNPESHLKFNSPALNHKFEILIPIYTECKKFNPNLERSIGIELLNFETRNRDFIFGFRDSGSIKNSYPISPHNCWLKYWVITIG